MHMLNSEEGRIAARLYVRLRHNAHRIIDCVWMLQNGEYAREVLRIARTDTDPEVLRLADRFEAITFGPPPAPRKAPEKKPASAAEGAASSEPAFAHNYVGALR
jgi:hypothetical protein